MLKLLTASSYGHLNVPQDGTVFRFAGLSGHDARMMMWRWADYS
jgi:hypothetical protein